MDEELRTQTQTTDWTALAEKATRLFSDAIDQVPTNYQGDLGKAFGVMQQAFEVCGTATGQTYHNLSPGLATPGTIGKGNWP